MSSREYYPEYTIVPAFVSLGLILAIIVGVFN